MSKEFEELEQFFSEALSEVAAAREKFPDSGGSMTALTEEVGELAKAMLDESSDRVRREAIQVACMAARVTLEGDPTLDPYRTETGAGPHPDSTAEQRRRSASVDTGRPSERGPFSHSRDCPDANGRTSSAAESPGLPVSPLSGRTTKPVAYIAHPLSGDRDRNRASAALWVSLLGMMGWAPVATWIVLAGLWDEETGRSLGLSIDCALVARCDVLLLCGPRISSGMQVEADEAKRLGVPIIDLTGLAYFQAEELLGRVKL